MSKQRRVKPSHQHSLEEQKQARSKKESVSGELETIVWQFSIIDLDGQWGWKTTAGRDCWEKILPKLQHLESMTWEEIKKATGGRGRDGGNNNHSVEVEKLTSQAKRRLAEIKQDDTPELFSLRLDSTTRIYGIRDRRALKLLWYDPYHGNNNKAVYPLQNR